MPVFKVIIVGGSIAGLTLANILERYGIDYVLYEKHGDIAPQLGASVGLLPHGARILDQLDIFKQIEDFSMPVNDGQSFGPDGRPLKEPESIGGMMEELLGYRMRFLDRQQLLQLLFDNLHDKSKIHTAAEVCKITKLERCVQVILKDGAMSHGDIIVGADGVHSRMRREIWRIAESQTPSYLSTRMKRSITCAYKCMFGISKRPEGTPDNMFYKAFHQNRSYLCVSGPGGKMYFFGFFKNPEVTVHDAIPRYSMNDARILATKYHMDTVFHNTTFGDLYEQQLSCVLVPLEEYVLEKCFYKRAVLIGDSFHKMNPLAAHGGNSAIESAALLADLLKGALDKISQPEDSIIYGIFSDFQNERRPRTRLLMESTRKLQRMEMLDNRFLMVLQLKITSKMGIKNMAPLVARSSTPGRTLRYLPQRYRTGLIALDEKVITNPHIRSSAATALWVGLMLFIALSSAVLSRLLNDGKTNDESGLFGGYISLAVFAFNGLWVVESYRPGLLFSPLFSGIPYILASTLVGWEVALPIYFALYIYISKTRSFYYPSPRAINPSAAKALLPALIFALVAPFARFATLHTQQKKLEFDLDPAFNLHLAYISLPILVKFGERLNAKVSIHLPVGELLFGTRDMKHLSRFFTFLFIFTSTAHLICVSKLLFEVYDDIGEQSSTSHSDWTRLGSLSIAVVSWCSFVVWDMRRVNLCKLSMPVAIICFMIGCVVLGPGAVLAILWRWRDQALENGRRML